VKIPSPSPLQGVRSEWGNRKNMKTASVRRSVVLCLACEEFKRREDAFLSRWGWEEVRYVGDS
jgi:hypothetical protein